MSRGRKPRSKRFSDGFLKLIPKESDWHGKRYREFELSDTLGRYLGNLSARDVKEISGYLSRAIGWVSETSGEK